MDVELLEHLMSLRQRREPGVLMTVVRTEGSTPRKAGAHMLLAADGTRHGSIGGGSVEHAVLHAARGVLESREPALVEHQLTAQLGMCCGGQMTIFLEPLYAGPVLLLLGYGTLTQALVATMAPLGFDIMIAAGRDEPEPEPELATRHPCVRAVVAGCETETFGAGVPWGDELYAVVTTSAQPLRAAAQAAACLRRAHRYVGVAAIDMAQAELVRRALPADVEVSGLHCPAGAAIGARNVGELAVAIAAELIAVRTQAPSRARTQARTVVV